MAKSANQGAKVNLTEGAIVKSIILFTLPLIVSYLFQQLYNSADTFIIGHFLEESSLISMGACSEIFELLVGFGVGFGNGMAIIAARFFGAKDMEMLKKVTAASLIITLCVSLAVMVFSFFGLKPLLLFLNTPVENVDEALSYILLIMVFSGVLFFYNLFSGMLRAIGNSFIPLIFLVFSSLLNIVLDLIFIKSMGLRGAAIATVLAQAMSALLCIIYIFFGEKILVPSRKHFKFDLNIYRNLAGQGLSMAMMTSIVHCGTVILQKGINNLDSMVIAGHLCARKVFGFVNIPFKILGISSATFISQNYGAGKIDRIKKGYKCINLMAFAWTAFLFVPICFFSRQIFEFISGSDNSIIIGYASSYLKISLYFFPVLSVLLITRNSLQGLGSKFLPLISSVIELLGKILFTLFIIPKMGQMGVILCEPIIWCIMTVQLVWAFVTHKKLSTKK